MTTLPVTETVAVEAGRWHDRIAGLVAGGLGFVTLWSTSDGGVGCVLADRERTVVVTTVPTGGTVESIIDIVGAAGWDEREIHDRRGIGFDGHDPLRPLLHHPHATSDWTTPVAGEDVHDVAVGPIHAGIIESGHFRFHVVGERILLLDPQLFYKHRGLEAAASGGTPELALGLAQRACGACAVTNTVVVAQAIEDARGAVPDDDLRRARTLLLELERLYNHLNDIGAVCAGIGFAMGNMAFAELKERAQRLNAALTGHRFLFGTVAVGSSDLVIDAAAADAARATVAGIGADAAALWGDIWGNRTARTRFRGAGILGHADALALGACGPAGRASGIDDDARVASPRLWYDGFAAARPGMATGDVAARIEMRVRELVACCAIIDDLTAAPIARGRVRGGDGRTGTGVGIVESPRGRTAAIIGLDAGTVTGMHLRTGSYANWPALAATCTGAILPDFPLINKSFELCYACVDR
jgi:Ni,Fe-hydrogenase III large subunit